VLVVVGTLNITVGRLLLVFGVLLCDTIVDGIITFQYCYRCYELITVVVIVGEQLLLLLVLLVVVVIVEPSPLVLMLPHNI
jgi:hypothetical protein